MVIITNMKNNSLQIAKDWKVISLDDDSATAETIKVNPKIDPPKQVPKDNSGPFFFLPKFN